MSSTMLIQAQSQILSAVEGVAASCSDLELGQLATWVRTVILPEMEARASGNATFSGEDAEVNARKKLDALAVYLRGKMPLEAVMPTEQISFPSVGDDSSLNSTNCVHVDGFLFDEVEEQRLIDEGRLARAYCKTCGSKDTEDLRYVTHSCSKARLEYIFVQLLPPLDGKHVLDVGSRLGAVLYGAYVFSSAARITGIEINAELCQLQEETITKFGLKDRIEVLHRELTTCADLLSSVDVVILNNVFDWFMPPEMQVKMWQFLYQGCKKGALIVTIPGVDKSLQHLQTGISLSSWLQPLNPRVPAAMNDDGDDDEDQVEMSEVKLYQVIKSN